VSAISAGHEEHALVDKADAVRLANGSRCSSSDELQGWIQKKPTPEILSPIQPVFFNYNQNAVLSTAQGTDLEMDDLDLDAQGKLVIRPEAFDDLRFNDQGKLAVKARVIDSRDSSPELEIDDENITVHDLYVGGDGMVRVDDAAANRVGVAPFRNPWEPGDCLISQG